MQQTDGYIHAYGSTEQEAKAAYSILSGLM
jgi:hypothetical protein